jgi:hypothetical protein
MYEPKATINYTISNLAFVKCTCYLNIEIQVSHYSTAVSYFIFTCYPTFSKAHTG